MEWLIGLLLLIFLVLFVLSKPISKRQADECSYEKMGPLFSPAERSFFGVLSQAVNGQGVVFGKVRVADVLKPAKGMARSNWQKAFNRISSKHFDYVICAPDTLSVLAVIELDDKSHNNPKRIERDRFLNRACSDAGLPLYRFKAAASYNVNEVRQSLFPAHQHTERQSPLSETHIAKSVVKPTCPKCASPLVKKVAKKGQHKGTEFIACSAFPTCRYIEKPKPQSGCA